MSLQPLEEQQQWQQQDNNSAAPPAAADSQEMNDISDAAAAGSQAQAHIGNAPLRVTGGRAAGAKVVWEQPARITLPRGSSSSCSGNSSGGSGIGVRSGAQGSNSSSKGGSDGSNSSTATTTTGASGRFRRRSMHLQGISAAPPPGASLPAQVAEKRENITTEPQPVSYDAKQQPGNHFWSAAELSSALEQLRVDGGSSWQTCAAALLPSYDPSWHCSLYTALQEAWGMILGGSSVIMAADTQDNTSNTVKQHSSAADDEYEGACMDAVTAWGLECLRHPRRQVWCIALLALVDALADDAAARVPRVVALLPPQLVAGALLAAAKALDDEVAAALGASMRPATAGTAAASSKAAMQHPLLGAAPWTTPGADGRGDGGDAPSADQVRAALYELQGLQPLYPGVELQSLAHLALLHGVWDD